MKKANTGDRRCINCKSTDLNDPDHNDPDQKDPDQVLSSPEYLSISYKNRLSEMLFTGTSPVVPLDHLVSGSVSGSSDIRHGSLPGAVTKIDSFDQ
jgi:hypothetical protein